jgi:hypothetical protein
MFSLQTFQLEMTIADNNDEFRLRGPLGNNVRVFILCLHSHVCVFACFQKLVVPSRRFFYRLLNHITHFAP